jgi:hypothetical protein
MYFNQEICKIKMSMMDAETEISLITRVLPRSTVDENESSENGIGAFYSMGKTLGE